MLSHAQLFAIPRTVAWQAPLSMEFSRQECWNGLPFPPPGDLPDPGSESVSLISPALVGRGLIPELRRSPGGGCGNPLQYSGLENPMDRGARRVTYSPWGHKESDTTERPSRGVDQVVPKPREVPGPRGSCQHRDTQAKSAKRPPYTPSLSLSDLADHLTGCGLLSVSWPGRQTLVSPFYRRDVLQRPRGHLRESHQVADSAGLIGNPFHAPRSFVTWGSEAGVCQPRVGPWDPSGQPLPHPFPSAWAHP